VQGILPGIRYDGRIQHAAVTIQETTHEMNEHIVRDRDLAERQALALRQAERFQPAIERHVDDLHAECALVAPNWSTLTETRVKCLEQVDIL